MSQLPAAAEEVGVLSSWGAAQTSVIGSMMVDERCIGDVMQATTAEMFSNSAMRHIYEVTRQLWLDRRKIDPVIVCGELGSDSYSRTIADCMRVTPTSANVLAYCEILTKCLRLSAFRQAAYALLDATTAEAAESVWDELGKSLITGKKKNIFSYREMADDFFNRLNDPAPPDYIDWGFQPLNNVMTVQAGHFVTIGAEASAGKTLLAFQLARHMAKSGKRVGFFSFETTKEDAEDRLMANGGDVSLYAIKYKRVDDAGIRRITEDVDDMYDVDFDLIEAAGYTVDDIRRDTIANRYDTVFVDYVQMVGALGDTEDVSRQVRNVSIGLHVMCMQLGCTVIALSQVTPPPRDKNGTRRYLSKYDLRESKQLVQDSQVVMLLDLTDINDHNSPRVLIVDKNKDGACGKMTLEIDAPHMRFRYLPPYEDPEAAAARDRNAVMDKNRAARQEKERQKAGIEGQTTFKELSDDEGGDIPF